MAEIKYLLFDAANTLIHKPSLWERIQNACEKHEQHINSELLRRNHKLISEVISFPDRTSSDFYREFNRELLYACGVIPSEELLSDIFESCTYLPWEPFEDTEALSRIKLPKGVLSNFNRTLTEKLSNFFPAQFSHVLISEQLECAKPSTEFYKKAIEMIGLTPEEIMYVGDSIKLDMEPAVKAGFHAVLIDRPGYYCHYNSRISSLRELEEMIS